MALTLTIDRSPGAMDEKAKTLTSGELTLGRGNDNDWVLPDLDRYLSSLHCRIICDNNTFSLTDLSTNGTFFNSSSQPIGRDQSVTLSDGDRFVLGDYHFSVSIWGEDAPLAHASYDVPERQVYAEDQSGFPAGLPVSDPHVMDPFSSPIASGIDEGPIPEAVVDEPSDPLAMLDRVDRGFSGADQSDPFQVNSDPFHADTYSDSAEGIHQAIDWPNAVEDSALIPDDWDDDSSLMGTVDDTLSPQVPLEHVVPTPSEENTSPHASSPSVLNPSVPKPSVSPDPSVHNPARAANNAIPRPSVGAPKSAEEPRAVSSQRQASEEAKKVLDDTLINALGLDCYDLSDEHIHNLNETIGELVREMVGGLMQVLRSRTSIKNEFRMNVTTIQPVENNPLKFSANIDDALENMFVKRSSAYKNPVDSVREGFQGVAEHQVALLAGMRSAFKSMMQRFDPAVLEKQFEHTTKGQLLSGIGKAKYWNAYADHYKDLADNMENSFQYLFGDEFVQSYEDQLRKLAHYRKMDSNKERE